MLHTLFIITSIRDIIMAASGYFPRAAFVDDYRLSCYFTITFVTCDATLTM